MRPNFASSPSGKDNGAKRSSSGVSWKTLAGAAAVACVGAVWYAPSLLSTKTCINSSNNGRPSVRIAQGTVIGKIVDDGEFPKPVEGFMGIPYAVPPVGQMRFREAQPVAEGNKTIYAFYMGGRCPGTNLVPFLESPERGPDFESEDCLSINIWRPMGHTASLKKLPVAVLLPGGAFNRGGAMMHDTHRMLAFSPEPWIAVSINYRIGVFGGLNNELTAKEGVLNLGLKDIYVALEWVQKNIAAFGGDPGSVTIMGLSAAAHAIGHLVMDINQNKTLFHKALGDSGAHTARAIHPPSAELHTQHFREMLDLTPCSKYTDLLDPEILTCLRSLPSNIIDAAGQQVYRRSDASVRWAWQPVIDGQIISRRPLDAWKSGKFHRVPYLIGSTHNEGSYYVPKSANKSEDFINFFRTLLPHMNDAEARELEGLYPNPAVHPESPYKDVSGNPALGSQFRRTEAAYGHYAYTCPVRQTAIYATADPQQGPPVFLYHWAVNKTAAYGANHGEQMRFQTYNKEIRSFSPTMDKISGSFHAYCVSFIVHGDPSAMTSGEFADRPRWKPWRASKGLTMLLGEGNDEMAGGSSKGVAAALKDYKWADKECQFWWRMSGKWEE